MADEHENSYVRFVLKQSRQHLSSIGNAVISPAEEARFAELAEGSILEQRQIEASDSLPFEEYRQRYLSPDRLGL